MDIIACSAPPAQISSKSGQKEVFFIPLYGCITKWFSLTYHKNNTGDYAISHNYVIGGHTQNQGYLCCSLHAQHQLSEGYTFFFLTSLFLHEIRVISHLHVLHSCNKHDIYVFEFCIFCSQKMLSSVILKHPKKRLQVSQHKLEKDWFKLGTYLSKIPFSHWCCC